jgi:hydrogenase nickel incorporation protein HypB
MHKTVTVDLAESVLEENRGLARTNRERLKGHRVRAFDFLGAVGSGKTMLIERLSELLAERGLKVGAIAGDVAGDDDHRRFLAKGIVSENLNTGKECHLDAHMVEHALEDMDLQSIDVLFIENVGNLVCPADFPLGAERRVVVISTTEGDDTVRKHPLIFRDADVCVINKVDLAGPVGVDVDMIEGDFRTINGHAPFIRTNAKTGEGVGLLLDALLGDRAS